MTRAAIYCRISRDRVGAGLGVARQEADCRQLATAQGWTAVTVHTDNDLSAYSGKPRPGYRQLLHDIAAGAVDVVIAWHTDRLHRSPTELEEYITACEAHNVPTHTVKAGPLDLATPSGRLVARQLGAVARYEVEHQVERQKRAKLQAATDGRWKGGRRPYGYHADGVTVRPDEAEVIRRAGAAILAGESLRGVVADLNRRGMPTSTGRPWKPAELRKVLLRPRNAGLMEHQRKVVGRAQWPAIVDEDEWRAVAAILTDPTRRTSWSTHHKWMMSGLARCGVCGEANGWGEVYCTLARGLNSYTCRHGKHIIRIASEVDAAVSAVVVERLSHDDARDLLVVDSGPNLGLLHTQALTLRGKLDELAAAYADDTIDAQQLRQGSDRVRDRLTAVETAIANTSRGSVFRGLVDAEDVAAAWKVLPLDRRRAVIDALMLVTINPARRGRRPGWKPGESYFDPRTLTIDWRA